MEGETFLSGVPPTLDFDSNCSKRFTLEFSLLSDFSDPRKIRSVTFSIAGANSQATVQKTLSSFQWNGITKSLGAEGHFRIKAWDGLNRKTVSEVRTFRIQ